MDLTNKTYGIWSGGRFMHFGEQLEESHLIDLVQLAYENGIRTFVTADVYATGGADELLGKALEGIDRSSYCLVGTIGHDFYNGKREGSKGYPRFTNPDLRSDNDYGNYLRSAAGKSLERCQADSFDLLMLHNPDSIGYTSEAVWKAMDSLKAEGFAERLGIAPGPANGFSLDIIHCLENYGELIDWAMLILNPMEPWPGRLVLPATEKMGVKVLARVVDYGGLFHDDVKPNHQFRPGDHRAYRPDGWVEAGNEKIEKMRPIAERHDLSMLQFASQWNLAHPSVESVVPTFIQEAGEGARAIEEKILDFAAMPEEILLTPDDVEKVAQIGDNEGCMQLKGASPRHEGNAPTPDQWAMRPELEAIAERWQINPVW